MSEWLESGPGVQIVVQLRGRRCFCPVRNIVLARKHLTATASRCSLKWRFCVVVVVHRRVAASQNRSPLAVCCARKGSRGLTLLFPFVRVGTLQKFATSRKRDDKLADRVVRPSEPRLPASALTPTELCNCLAPPRAAVELNLSAPSVVFAANR